MVDDLEKDPNFEVLDEPSINDSISEDMELPVGLAIRCPSKISSAYTMLIINATLRICNRHDLMISRRGVDNVRKRILDKAVERRKVEDRNFIKMDMDGKISETAIGKNKLKKKDNITVVSGTTGRYIEHFVPSGRGTGKNIGLGFTNVIAETDSWETMRAIGCGKNYFYIKCFYIYYLKVNASKFV